ncbi:MAG: 5-bromo-4-chloroindolyl phosphate hydrolysis family protein [Eggerthellaceae bacterium]|nr:5-bromo-4-chloroindolyl phosphate hydrolysis family protein [Eggerthellaceae bacterium]
MKNNSGMSTAAVIALAIGLLLLLSSCSLQSAGKFMFTMAIIVGLALLAFAIVIACVALKKSSEEARGASATKVQGTSTSTRKGTTGMRTSERVNGAINASPELKSARQTITEEKLLVGRVNDSSVRESATRVLEGATKVLETLAQKQEKIYQSHQYLNYYLPTLGLILKKFGTLEANGMATDAMRDKVVKYLGDIEEVMNKQYESLFSDDILDLAVEMEAMTISCKRDGLLSEDDVQIKDGEQVIKLEM